MDKKDQKIPWVSETGYAFRILTLNSCFTINFLPTNFLIIIWISDFIVGEEKEQNESWLSYSSKKGRG